MAIYRGPGGSGDATADSANTAQVAQDFATQAGVSASAAAGSAIDANTAKVAAEAAKTAAETAQTAAELAETNAETAETNAETAQTAAEAAQTAAEAAQTAAETAETNAETAYANTLAIFGDATDVANAVAAAQLAETNAETAETNAETAQTAAEAAQLAAENAQTAAELAETNAETAETGALAAQAAAESARDSALAAYDNFDDRYLGAKTSDPTLDNDGNALVAGALYFNSVNNAMRVYTGSVWVDAYASGTSFLAKANNLSDLTNVATARQNLDLEIGVDVQAYDATILKSADIGVTVQGYDATTLKSADIGVTVQGYDATIVVDADIGVTVQGYSSVLQNTNASFTTTDETKLDGIEAGADVTDSINVEAAGAAMDSDFTSQGLMKRGATSGSYSIVTDNSSNWDTAYSWGDHSSEGYLTTAVTSATAGTGISVSSSTGAVTFNNTAPDQTVALTAGTGISTSGTYPNFTITNSAPDQTVSLTGSGATSISGTYPNFTISSTDTNTTYTAGTGLSLAGTTFSNSDRGSSQNIFKNIAVSGQSTIVADSNNDTVTVVAGTGVALTTNATTDTLTITNSAPDQTVAISSGTGISVSGTYPNFTVAATNNGTVTSVGLSAPTGFSVTGSPVSTTGTLALSFATGYSLPTTASQTNWNTAYGWGDHAAAGYLDAADIGVTVQGYDVDTAKYDATTANFTGTLQNGGSNVLVDTDIGSTVQAYDATIVVDADIGVTVQGYDADTAKYDDTTANFTGTLQNGGSNVLVDTDIGSTVQAYDSNLTSFVNTFTLPTTDGSSGQILTTNGTGTLSFSSPGGSGTVTSVGMTVPTGLTVSGSPITSSGTLAVTYSAGYAIPTTTKQSNWDTAYSWGNHALAGYAADSAVVKLTGNQTIAGTKTFSSTISGSITGNAGTVTNGVYTTGNQTIGGTKTFSSTISGSITGNAGTVTNGVVTTGSYANPSWITSLSETKVLPSQTSQSGKYLTTNGTSTSWATVDALPSQTGNSGKYLTTDGTTASWATVSGGQYLGTAATKAIMYNAQSIAENITISGSYNALSAGPITIDSTYTVTVSSGAVWTIV